MLEFSGVYNGDGVALRGGSECTGQGGMKAMVQGAS